METKLALLLGPEELVVFPLAGKLVPNPGEREEPVLLPDIVVEAELFPEPVNLI